MYLLNKIRVVSGLDKKKFDLFDASKRKSVNTTITDNNYANMQTGIMVVLKSNK